MNFNRDFTHRPHVPGNCRLKEAQYIVTDHTDENMSYQFSISDQVSVRLG